MKEHNHESSEKQHIAAGASASVQLSPLPTAPAVAQTPGASTPSDSKIPTHAPHDMKPKRDMSALYVPASIIVAAFIIAAGLYFGLAARSGSTAQQGNNQLGQQPAANADIKKVDISWHPFIGRGNAPVVMAYWFDYQCPFCKAFDTGGIPQIKTPAALPDLIKNYVNTGKLKIVFFDYPFLGNDSTTAAEYAHAIWELYPSQWFAWHEAMYKAQDEEGDKGFGNAKTIDQLIQSSFPQMDDAKIRAQIVAHKTDYDKAMQDDRNLGSAQGVNGTPGFVVGTTLISGAEQYSAFTATIDSLLK